MLRVLVCLPPSIVGVSLLLGNGSVYGFGDNRGGVMGLGYTSSVPTPLPIHIGARVTRVSCGAEHTLFLSGRIPAKRSSPRCSRGCVRCTVAGTVYGCGSNEFGQLGLPHDHSKEAAEFEEVTPVLLPGLEGIVALAAGEQHSMFVSGWKWPWFGVVGVTRNVDRLWKTVRLWR